MTGDLDDPTLGRLTWYADREAWVAEVAFRPDHPIEVIVEFRESQDEPAAVLALARGWLCLVRTREPEFRAWSAERLVEHPWLAGSRRSAADLRGLLSLISIICDASGTADLCWDDDDEFSGGHAIVTRVGPDGVCVEVDIV